MTTKPVLSFQLYSAKNFPPIADVLEVVAALGFSSLEPYPGLFDDMPSLCAAMKINGLTAPSAHFSFRLLEDEFERSASIDRALDCSLVVISLIPADPRVSGRQ
jgi:sugar phosphate isomerase/epimerase